MLSAIITDYNIKCYYVHNYILLMTFNLLYGLYFCYKKAIKKYTNTLCDIGNLSPNMHFLKIQCRYVNRNIIWYKILKLKNDYCIEIISKHHNIVTSETKLNTI